MLYNSVLQKYSLGFMGSGRWLSACQDFFRSQLRPVAGTASLEKEYLKLGSSRPTAFFWAFFWAIVLVIGLGLSAIAPPAFALQLQKTPILPRLRQEAAPFSPI